MLVSVIIPTHNRAKLVKRAIESVRVQTLKDLEIIVVSDGSRDETDSVLEEYKQVDDRIRYINYEMPKGANYARNLGIKEASGKYIAFLDDDDEWVHTKLQQQVEILEQKKEVGLVYCGVKAIYINENISYINMPSVDGNISKKIYIKNYIGITSTVMIRKDILKKTDLFDVNLPARQDYDLWIRVCQLCNVDYVKAPLVLYYNERSLNQISSDVKKYEKAIEIINTKYSKELEELTIDEQEKRYLENIFMLANKSLRNNNGQLARKYLIKGFKQKITKKHFIFFIMTFLGYTTCLRILSINKRN